MNPLTTTAPFPHLWKFARPYRNLNRHPGSVMALPSDEQMVSALLDALTMMSTREQARATGLTHTTLRRLRKWRSGEADFELRASTRRAIVTYLETRHAMPKGVEPLSDPERVRLLELAREMVRLLEGGKD